MRTVPKMVAGLSALLALGAGLAACGSDEGAGGSGSSIVVTSNIVGDVVRHLVGDQVPVEVVMPPGASPHDFSASARQAADMREASVLVTNGLGFEAGLADTIDAAEHDGVRVLSLAELAPRRRTIAAHDGEPAGPDPHVFTDPARMAVATAALARELAAAVPALDDAAFRARAAAYVAQLRRLDGDVARELARIPAGRRTLVTNHEVLGYFADRYGFTVLGTVIPSLSTLAEPSAADLDDLAAAVRRAGVPAVFADTSSPKRLAEALAGEGEHVRVVTLFAESLGGRGSGAATYVEMERTNARRIADALARPAPAGG